MSYKMQQEPDAANQAWKHGNASAGSAPAHGSVDPFNDQPWPLRDAVRKLCDAAEILLHEKNYDGHGHEEISRALKVGREWSGPPNSVLGRTTPEPIERK
jgi:hypothetical protein